MPFTSCPRVGGYGCQFSPANMELGLTLSITTSFMWCLLVMFQPPTWWEIRYNSQYRKVQVAWQQIDFTNILWAFTFFTFQSLSILAADLSESWHSNLLINDYYEQRKVSLLNLTITGQKSQKNQLYRLQPEQQKHIQGF